MATMKQKRASKRNIKKARKTWMGMSKRQRQLRRKSWIKPEDL